MLLSEYCTWKLFEINPYFLILRSILAWFHLSYAFFPLRALHYMLSSMSSRDKKSNSQEKHDYFSTLVSLKPSLFSRLVGFLLSVHHLPASSGSLQCFINVTTSELFIWVFCTQNCICVIPSKLWAQTPLAGHVTNCNLLFFFCFKWKCLTRRPISFTQDKCCTYDSGFSCSSSSD